MYPTLEFAIVSFSLIFFIVDPLGNIPFFLGLTEGASAEERKKTAFRASLAWYFILRESGRLLHLLRQTGINVLGRLMGLLLAVIAVQFVVDGIKAVFLLEITAGR